MPQKRVSCVDQDSVPAADCNFVSEAGFSGKQVLELWPILSGDVGPTVAPSTTVARRRNHHKRRVSNVPALAGNHSSKVSTTVFSCTCLETNSSHHPVLSQQNPMVSTRLVEILAEEATRTIHTDGREEQSEAVTEHEDSHGLHVEAPCRVDGEVGSSELLDIW